MICQNCKIDKNVHEIYIIGTVVYGSKNGAEFTLLDVETTKMLYFMEHDNMEKYDEFEKNLKKLNLCDTCKKLTRAILDAVSKYGLDAVDKEMNKVKT